MQKKVEIDEALINIIRRGVPSDMTATQLREMVFPQIESEHTPTPLMATHWLP